MALREQTQRLLSQEDVTADNVEEMYGVKGVDPPDITAKDVGMFIAESTPFLGEAIGIKRTSDALDEGDYVGAGIEGAATLVGVLPVVGDAAAKGIRASANALRTPKWFKETKVDTDLAPDSSRKTQITTTTPTYRKVRDLLPEGKTLDFGSGKGVGARDVGFDTYEPFPDADFTPNHSSAKDISDESYENVTSLNVLNVVKPETRTEIVTDIGRILKPGGTAIITTRGADVFGNAKNPVKGVLGDEPGSVITSSGTYQKGFTQSELQEYVQETLGKGFKVVNISGAGQAGVKIIKDAPAPRMGYDPNNESSRVFHLTKANFDTADVIGSGTSDIGFHVGTAQQATARGSTQTNYDPELAEQMVKGERILPMVLKADLKPARIVDMSNFKVPGSWLANLSVASSDLQRIKFLKGDESDAPLFAKAPKVKVDGETYTMLPDAMRAGMDESLWRDIVLEAHGAKRRGLDTINSQEDRIAWFNTLKETANKNGYDSFVYRNEYEGTADKNIDELVEQIQRAQRGEIDPAEVDMNSRFADSYMLLEPNQVKGLFGGMTESSPEFMKNKGGLMLQKGGAVPMQKQMEMFEDGGLMDEGGTIDPVSGNDVPPGSTQEEVRDDIPAQLSEGEFVFPADVVRYIGLGNLMRMRQEAKLGLRLMDEMGQMGNSDEASMPDDMPFDINDLDMEDEPEYNVGGFVPGTAQQQQFGITGFQQAPAQTMGAATQPVQAASQQFVPQPITRPAQAYVPVQQVPTPLPTFGEITGPGVPEVDYEFATFRNEAGQEIQLKIKKGSQGELLPGEVLPDGYSWVDPTATKTEEVTTTPTTGQTTQTVSPDDDGDSTNDSTGGGILSFGGTAFKGTVTGNYRSDISFQGLTFGQARQRMTAGVGQFFDFKQNKTPELPKGATAIITNIKPPGKDPDGRDARVIRAKVQLDSNFFNRNIANTNVSKRQDLARTLDWVRKNYEREFLDDKDNVINAELAFKTMQQEEKNAETAKQVRAGNFGSQDDSSSTGYTRGSVIDRAIKDAQQMVRDDDDEAFSGVTVSQAELDAARQSAPTLAQAQAQDTYEDDSAAYADYDSFFNDGGLASKPKPKPKKKMKRGGLASKK